jgi:hypothetical protein
MANPEHLESLLQGAEAWADWREFNPDVNPDLGGAQLSGRDLGSSDLVCTNLTRADLRRAKLTQCNLAGPTFAGADLTGAELPESVGKQLSDLAIGCGGRCLGLYNARSRARELVRYSQFPACHHDLACSAASLCSLNCWHCLMLTEPRSKVSAVTA